MHGNPLFQAGASFYRSRLPLHTDVFELHPEASTSFALVFEIQANNNHDLGYSFITYLHFLDRRSDLLTVLFPFRESWCGLLDCAYASTPEAALIRWVWQCPATFRQADCKAHPAQSIGADRSPGTFLSSIPTARQLPLQSSIQSKTLVPLSSATSPRRWSRNAAQNAGSWNLRETSTRSLASSRVLGPA